MAFPFNNTKVQYKIYLNFKIGNYMMLNEFWRFGEHHIISNWSTQNYIFTLHYKIVSLICIKCFCTVYDSSLFFHVPLELASWFFYLLFIDFIWVLWHLGQNVLFSARHLTVSWAEISVTLDIVMTKMPLSISQNLIQS